MRIHKKKATKKVLNLPILAQKGFLNVFEHSYSISLSCSLTLFSPDKVISGMKHFSALPKYINLCVTILLVSRQLNYRWLFGRREMDYLLVCFLEWKIWIECTLECFQMKSHVVKKCSSSDKVLAHTTKRHLAQILYKKNFGKGLRKAKNWNVCL